MGNPFKSTSGSDTSQTGTSSQTANQQTQSNQNITGNTSGQQTVTPNEDPLFTMFRQSVLPAIASQYADAQKDVYGDAQKAGAVNDANNIYNAQEQNLANSAARRGVLNSGAYSSGANALAQGRASGITSFFNQIPFLNSQAKFGRTQDLLGLATNFLGKSPLGQTTTSNQSSNQNATGNTSSTGNTTGTTSATGKTDQWGNPSLFSSIGQVASIF